MKPNPYRSIATHLVGVMAGGALAYVMIAAPPREERPPPAKHRSTTLAAKFSPTVKLELERLMEELDAEADRSEKPTTLRERNLRAIEEQPLIDLRNEKELMRLWSVANTFVGTKDLGPTLTNALAADDKDLTRAIFLEWHRRDPVGAFDALAELGAWIESFDDVLVLAVPNDQIIAQLSRDDRSEEFGEHLATRLGAKLGAADDLQGLTQALDGIRPKPWGLFAGFTETWIPDDGVEAARFIGLDMKPDHQERFLRALLGQGTGPYEPEPWTKEFAESLFDYDLHVPQPIYEALTSEAAASAGIRKPFPKSPKPGLEPGLDSIDARDTLDALLDGALHDQCDYPELLAADAVRMDEIAVAMKKVLPETESYPGLLERALFHKLAAHNPARVIIWANVSVLRSDLDKEIDIFVSGVVNHRRMSSMFLSTPSEDHVWEQGGEPRTRRLAELMAVLQPTQMVDTNSDYISDWALGRFDDWSRLAPESAGRSLDRIAPSHPIRRSAAPNTAGP